jgi:hypothetical protein
MLIKPYRSKGQDIWFHIKQPRIGDVDMADRWFGVKGEFSPSSDIAFKKHIDKLNGLAHSPFFNRYNGQKIKKILEFERLWL